MLAASSDQPAASLPGASSQDENGTDGSGNQRAESADRADQRDGKAGKNGESRKDRADGRGKDKPGKGKDK